MDDEKLKKTLNRMASSVEGYSVLQKRMMSDFVEKFDGHIDPPGLDDEITPEDMMKYCTMGWYIYRILLSEKNIDK